MPSQRLRFQKAQAGAVLTQLRRLAQTHAHYLRELFQIILIPDKRGEAAAFYVDAHTPAAVSVDGGISVHIKASEIAQQAPLGEGLRPAHAAQLPGHGAQDIRNVQILPPGHAAVFRQEGTQLPPVGQAPQLGVDGGDKGGQVFTLLPEKFRQVIYIKAAVLDHGLGGVVHGGERIHILGIPAAVLVFALDADLVCRPVIDAGDVLIVIGLHNIPAHRIKKLGIGLAEGFDPAGHKAAEPHLPAASLRIQEHEAKLHKQGGGQQHKQHRGAEGFKQGADVDLRIPGADYGQGAGEDEAEHKEHPAMLAENSGQQAGKGIGHGIKGGALMGHVHGKAQHCAYGGPGEQPALHGGGHNQHKGQHPAYGHGIEYKQP